MQQNQPNNTLTKNTHMKRIALLAITALVLLGSCKKEDKCPYTESTASAPANERAYLSDYLTNASLTATEHSSGIYYEIVTQGNGTSPTVCSGVTVQYTGTFIPTGVQFDASNSAGGMTFALGNLITGWQKGLTLIKPGGKIILYVPPSLGYGYQDIRDNSGALIMPGNAYLKFEIELLSVQ